LLQLNIYLLFIDSVSAAVESGAKAKPIAIDSNFAMIFDARKFESMSYCIAFRDPMFSRFDTIPECD